MRACIVWIDNCRGMAIKNLKIEKEKNLYMSDNVTI